MDNYQLRVDTEYGTSLASEVGMLKTQVANLEINMWIF